jgi:molybdopterin-guanine dinucleotide biosynthesis protein A
LKAVSFSRSKLTHASRFKKERKPNKIEVNGNFYFPAFLNNFAQVTATRKNPVRSPPKSNLPVEICILAGGLSSRMGKNKSRMRLGNCTLLGHVRVAAKNLKVPVRVIRRDLVSRCGPLGGIFTALKTTKAEAVLFLACDMPFVSPELVEKLLQRSTETHIALFTKTNRAGFPFLIKAEALPIVENQIEIGDFSLQSLAQKTEAAIFHPPPERISELFNVNTQEDWAKARAIFRTKA